MISLAFLMIFVGAMVAFQLVHESKIIVSFLCYFGLVLLHLIEQYSHILTYDAKITENFTEFMNNKKTLFSSLIKKQHDKKTTLLNILLYAVMPYFPIVYLLGFLEFFDNEQFLVAYGVGSLIGKIIFCSFITNMHMNLQSEVIHLISTQATLTKHALEVKSTELKNMIANVAHDLKTVSVYTLY
jgi:hypothetical protein